MNMISTGAFQTEVDVSDKQKNSMVSKLVRAWEEKNSKTARAGGVSLLALSLAACGSSDDDSAGSGGTYSEAEMTVAKSKAKSDALTDSSGVLHADVDAAIKSNDTKILTDSSGVLHADVDTAIKSNDTKIASDAAAAVDKTSDNAEAVSLALRNEAVKAGVNTFDGMSDAALMAAIIASDNDGISDKAVADLGLSGISTLAQLKSAYDAAIAP